MVLANLRMRFALDSTVSIGQIVAANNKPFVQFKAPTLFRICQLPFGPHSRRDAQRVQTAAGAKGYVPSTYPWDSLGGIFSGANISPAFWTANQGQSPDETHWLDLAKLFSFLASFAHDATANLTTPSLSMPPSRT